MGFEDHPTIDYFNGNQLGQMSPEQIELIKIAVKETLKSIGLDDENAANDIRDLRDALRDFKSAKKIASAGFVIILKRLWGFGTKLAGTLFIIYILVKLGINTDKLQKMGEMIDLTKP